MNEGECGAIVTLVNEALSLRSVLKKLLVNEKGRNNSIIMTLVMIFKEAYTNIVIAYSQFETELSIFSVINVKFVERKVTTFFF